jgi:hypothetical protein
MAGNYMYATYQVSSENSLFCFCIPKFRVGDGVLVNMGRAKTPAQVTEVNTVSRVSTSLVGSDTACCQMLDIITCGYTKPKRYSVRFEVGGPRKVEHNVPGERMVRFRAEITVDAELVTDDEEEAAAVACVAAVDAEAVAAADAVSPNMQP